VGSRQRRRLRRRPARRDEGHGHGQDEGHRQDAEGHGRARAARRQGLSRPRQYVAGMSAPLPRRRPRDRRLRGGARPARAAEGGPADGRQLLEVCPRRIDRLDPRSTPSARSSRAGSRCGGRGGHRARPRRRAARLPRSPSRSRQRGGRRARPRRWAPAPRAGGRPRRRAGARLRAAGAVVVGTTHLPELALWPSPSRRPGARPATRGAPSTRPAGPPAAPRPRWPRAWSLRDRLRRRRLDPHPRRLLRAGRAQAAARAGARSRPSTGTGCRSPAPHPHRRRPGARAVGAPAGAIGRARSHRGGAAHRVVDQGAGPRRRCTRPCSAPSQGTLAVLRGRPHRRPGRPGVRRGAGVVRPPLRARRPRRPGPLVDPTPPSRARAPSAAGQRIPDACCAAPCGGATRRAAGSRRCPAAPTCS
jgi:hypothetical protein